MNTPPVLHVALCANGVMLPGLHVTLFSLVKNVSERENVSLTIFIQDVPKADIQALTRTVELAGGVGSLDFRPADISDFKDLKPLAGEWIPYLRLYFPTLLPEAKRILYLDCDLIVQTDVAAFFTCDLGKAPLAAASGPPLKWCIDHKFYSTVGLHGEDRAFNSGVLLFDAQAWRDGHLGPQAVEFGRTHFVHDQTILNGLYSRTFYGLPERFNTPVSADTPPLSLSDGIFHFVGSPKPWDPGGRFLHRNWRLWDEAIRRTSFDQARFVREHWRVYLARTWQLRRSYFRTLLRKF